MVVLCVVVHAQDQRRRFLARFPLLCSFPRASCRSRWAGPHDKRLKSTLVCSPSQFPGRSTTGPTPRRAAPGPAIHLSKYQSISWNRRRLCPGRQEGNAAPPRISRRLNQNHCQRRRRRLRHRGFAGACKAHMHGGSTRAICVADDASRRPPLAGSASAR